MFGPRSLPCWCEIESATVTSTLPLTAIRLTDAVGRTALLQAGGTGAITLDLSSVPAGLYLLEVETESGQVLRKRLVVE